MPAGKDATRIALLTALGAFAIYALTATRTIQGGDVAELTLVGTLGGVAHPPGYPLWSILAFLIGRVPFGSPALRLALFSATCAALTVGMTVRISRRLGASAQASVAASLCLALAVPFWRMAGVPEVFALAALLATLCIDASLTLAESGAPRDALILGAVLGLSAAHHQTSLFVLPVPMLVMVDGASRHGWRQAGKLLAIVLLGVAGGLSLYGWLFLAPRIASPGAPVWGDPSSLRGILDHVLRREYGTLRLGVASTGRDPLGNAGWMLRSLALDLALLPAFVAPAALPGLWRTRRAIGAGLCGSFVLSAVLFPMLFNVGTGVFAREVQARFEILPLVLMAPLIAVGVSRGIDAFLLRADFDARVARASVLLLLFVPLAFLAMRGYPRANWARDRSVERWHVVAARGAAPDAVILGGGDVSGPAFAWVQGVLGLRRDLHYLDINLVRLRWYYDRELAPIPGASFAFDEKTTHVGALANAFGARPVYVIPAIASLVAPSHPLHVEGLLFRVGGEEDAVRDRDSLARALADLDLAQSEPADAWSTAQRAGVAIEWQALAAEFVRAGREEDARVCVARAAGVQ